MNMSHFTVADNTTGVDVIILAITAVVLHTKATTSTTVFAMGVVVVDAAQRWST